MEIYSTTGKYPNFEPVYVSWLGIFPGISPHHMTIVNSAAMLHSHNVGGIELDSIANGLTFYAWENGKNVY